MFGPELLDFDFYYKVTSGALFVSDSEDARALIARCYSGKGSARNDPAREREIATGPIPRGLWYMEAPVDHKTLGPVAIRLTPFGHDAHGRSGFLIHGDNRRGDGSASSGCIIADRATRDLLALSIRFGRRRLAVD